ncbi:hypothetical protein ROZALSC1DRAFT_22949 [Rozella allomycis CSF55]|uniref:Uncharacterized protein n=1 Tax=Rozella allomycis (strain CSF55) TaxID=988480 RepID=A0A4P9YIS7_ROZAC|nr:hypothetical protein ROZALSC1DRAFT_22949 [Rozella allomycis CSF55]
MYRDYPMRLSSAKATFSRPDTAASTYSTSSSKAYKNIELAESVDAQNFKSLNEKLKSSFLSLSQGSIDITDYKPPPTNVRRVRKQSAKQNTDNFTIEQLFLFSKLPPETIQKHFPQISSIFELQDLMLEDIGRNEDLTSEWDTVDHPPNLPDWVKKEEKLDQSNKRGSILSRFEDILTFEPKDDKRKPAWFAVPELKVWPTTPKVFSKTINEIDENLWITKLIKQSVSRSKRGATTPGELMQILKDLDNPCRQHS